MRVVAIVLITSIFGLGVGNAYAQQDESTAWRKVAETIPLGSKVKVQIDYGKRVSGTLMRVDETSIMVKRNTRRPEPAVVVPFDEIGKLERDLGQGGTNIAKAIGIGLAAGAGVFFSLILIALQMD